MKGVGKGLAGVVVKPVVGVTDSVISVAQVLGCFLSGLEGSCSIVVPVCCGHLLVPVTCTVALFLLPWLSLSMFSVVELFVLIYRSETDHRSWWCLQNWCWCLVDERFSSNFVESVLTVSRERKLWSALLLRTIAKPS